MKCSTRDILNKPYARMLIRDEDGTYTAEILEFPGCYAEGDTPTEAIDDLEKAAAAWIEAAAKQKQEIPDPIDSYGYSGRINLRLPKSIHKQAARLAKKDRVSLNLYFASAIAARVGAEDLLERLVDRIVERVKESAIPSVSTVQILNINGIQAGLPWIPNHFSSIPDVTFSCKSPNIEFAYQNPISLAVPSLPQKAIANG
jgi:predicted RNase H-like HicB family nuclease